MGTARISAAKRVDGGCKSNSIALTFTLRQFRPRRARQLHNKALAAGRRVNGQRANSSFASCRHSMQISHTDNYRDSGTDYKLLTDYIQIIVTVASGHARRALANQTPTQTKQTPPLPGRRPPVSRADSAIQQQQHSRHFRPRRALAYPRRINHSAIQIG